MITVDEVKKIALLARIGLQEEEIARHQKSLSGILDYFEQLRSVSVEDIDSSDEKTLQNIYRDDVVAECDEVVRKHILKNAPETKDGFIQVKSVF